MIIQIRRYQLILGVLLASLNFYGCVHPKVRYHKKRILDVTMDPSKTSGVFSANLYSQAGLGIEKASEGKSESLGASCPSCGG